MTTDHQGAEALIRAAEVLEREARGLKHSFCCAHSGKWSPDESGARQDHDEMIELAKALRAWNRRPAPASDLRAAAQAVVDRWDSPQWKDEPHTAEFINRLRRALEAVGGDGLPELPEPRSAMVLNKHGEIVAGVQLDPDGRPYDTAASFDRSWPALAPHRIGAIYTADQMRQYARDALAAAKVPQALGDKQIMRGWLDWTEPGCSATDAFVAGVRFTEKHHGITPPSDSAAEGGGENGNG